jgi:hypothetical protein
MLDLSVEISEFIKILYALGSQPLTQSLRRRGDPSPARHLQGGPLQPRSREQCLVSTSSRQYEKFCTERVKFYVDRVGRGLRGMPEFQQHLQSAMDNH